MSADIDKRGGDCGMEEGMHHDPILVRAGFGNAGFGNAGFGNAGFGNAGCGNAGLGN
jgi:hypothetical protein